MLVPAAVIMAFATYLYALTGSWTAWYRAQSTGWVRQLTWPWDSFLNTVPAILPGAYANHPWWAAVFRGEMISMAVGVGVTIWCIAVSLRARKRSDGTDRPMWGEASWVGVQVVAFSLSYWFFSVNRATLLWFPLWIMLGRWVVGESGVYLTRVIDRKESRGKTFLVTDGGLQHQLAASGNFGQLLRRNYPVAIASRFGAESEEEVTVTGCLCTPLDLLADEAMLPRADSGDLVAIFCAGAYGLSASPQEFLSQPMAREMLV